MDGSHSENEANSGLTRRGQCRSSGGAETGTGSGNEAHQHPPPIYWWPDQRHVNRVFPADSMTSSDLDRNNFRYQLYVRPGAPKPEDLRANQMSPHSAYDVKRMAADRPFVARDQECHQLHWVERSWAPYGGRAQDVHNNCTSNNSRGGTTQPTTPVNPFATAKTADSDDTNCHSHSSRSSSNTTIASSDASSDSVSSASNSSCSRRQGFDENQNNNNSYNSNNNNSDKNKFNRYNNTDNNIDIISVDKIESEKIVYVVDVHQCIGKNTNSKPKHSDGNNNNNDNNSKIGCALHMEIERGGYGAKSYNRGSENDGNSKSKHSGNGRTANETCATRSAAADRNNIVSNSSATYSSRCNSPMAKPEEATADDACCKCNAFLPQLGLPSEVREPKTVQGHCMPLETIGTIQQQRESRYAGGRFCPWDDAAAESETINTRRLPPSAATRGTVGTRVRGPGLVSAFSQLPANGTSMATSGEVVPGYGTYKIIGGRQYHETPECDPRDRIELPAHLAHYREYQRVCPCPRLGRYDRADPDNLLMLPCHKDSTLLRTSPSPFTYLRNPKHRRRVGTIGEVTHQMGGGGRQLEEGGCLLWILPTFLRKDEP